MDVFSLINTARSRAASDLHLVTSSPPLIRVDGHLEAVADTVPLTADDTRQAFLQITTAEQRNHFQEYLELDFGYGLPGIGRLRCNVAQQRGSISLALRLLPSEVPTIDELELPGIYKELILKQRGLLIVTGPTGSGKTTTQAAMIHHLNLTEGRHVVTVEDPIEYIHPNIKCAITQRQLGSDTHSYPDALKHILRQDPDVILIGEVRDSETAAAVLSIAETGHLVLTTGHAPSTDQAIERVIDLFPPHERHLAQTRLASLLLAVLCQQLVPRADRPGRIAAVEIMLANPAVRNLIREGKPYQLPSVICTHHEIGMISMDEALVDLYHRRKIGLESLLEFCKDEKEVRKLTGMVKGKE
ncbi:MAG: PilT/PilU family type 4a pilus ATPase [Dehalococcoidales bacterium]|nr:PilT/PilU family type 4a pilus ATPase [Dehalococcoidales bacterium]